MNELQIFKNEEFGKIEILIENGKEYFPATEIAKILGYVNPRKAILDHCKKEGVTIRDGVLNTGLGEQIVSKKYIDEGNLYRLIIKSNLPKAEVFESWVFDEVLPIIRKKGMYMTDNVYETLINNPTKLGEMLIQYGKVRDENKDLKLQNKVQEQQIIELQPKALYYDLILQCKVLLATTTIAKDYGMSAKSFNKLLHELEVQYNQGGIWFLYQKYAIYGYTQTKTNPFSRTDGSMDSRPHMYWTQKGRLFLYDFLKEKGILPTIENEKFGEIRTVDESY